MSDAALSQRLDLAVARGLVGVGQAHRVALAGALATTLSSAGGTPAPDSLSGEALGRSLGLSRAAVHKHVEQLRELGFAVSTAKGSGYRLDRDFDDLVVAEAVLPLVIRGMDTRASWTCGLPYRYLAACVSTNAELKAVAASEPAGTALVTDEQTGGRGRLGRAWVSRPGEDLTFSVLLRPQLGPAQAHLLSLAAALAVAEVLEGLEGLSARVGIKWPNDVLVGGKKVCGILLEGSMDSDRLQWVVAGVGLNVNSSPAALMNSLAADRRTEWQRKPEPTSLQEQLGTRVPRAPLLARLLGRLTQGWTDFQTDGLLEGLRARDVLAGRPVEVLSGPPRDDLVVAGEALGVGAEGQLLVRVASGEIVPVFAGDVTVRTPGGA